MIPELVSFAKSQPFLVGGVGTVALSSGLYLIRSIPIKLGSFISNSLVSNFLIDNSNDYYNAVNQLIFQAKLSWTFRNYEPAEKEEDYLGDEVRKGNYLIPGYGSGWGIWKGILFSFYKEREDQGYRSIKKLYIRFYTRQQTKIEEFFKDAILLTEKFSQQKLYISNSSHWNRVADKRFRPMDTIFLNSSVKENILSRIDFFIKNEDLYLQRGIPYKFCMLFYGEPGTGKTSLIHAIASHFKFNIYYIERLGNLQRLFSAEVEKALIVIEDIDSLSEKLDREDEEENKPAGVPVIVEKKAEVHNAFHDLLNSLDGFMSQHGLMIAITSNHPGRLDTALIRPGRIDLAVEIGSLDLEAARQMFFAFYSKDSNSQAIWKFIARDYVPVVGSKLQEIFLNNDASAARLALAALFGAKQEAPQMATGGQN